jgi:hypothetical protein
MAAPISAIDPVWFGTAVRNDRNGAKTFRVRYRVTLETTSVVQNGIDLEQGLAILEDPRLPADDASITLRGTTYYVSSRDVEPPDETNRVIWFVAIEYTDTLDNGDGDLDQPPGNNNPNPTDDTPYWEFDSGDGTKFTNRDIDGNLITNTAGDPPEPIAVFDPHPVVNFHRNEASFTWATTRQYTAKVNSSTWNGAPAKTVLCRKIRATQRWRNGIPYYAVVYQFEFKDLEEGWQHLLSSLGYRQKVESTGDGETSTELVPIYVNGEPTQEPMPLDLNGKLCPPGYEDETEWKVYKSVDFNPLNIILPS